MIEHPYNGRLILFEGLDASGKTTIAKLLEEKMRLNKYSVLYCKGMGSDSFWGRLDRRHPLTVLFLIEQLWITQAQIRPALKKGKTVILDRYYFSVASHVPAVTRWWNKFWLKFFGFFLLLPDQIVLVTVSPEKRLARLKVTAKQNRFHQYLIDHPEMIAEREKVLQDLLSAYPDRLVRIDTTLDLNLTWQIGRLLLSVGQPPRRR